MKSHFRSPFLLSVLLGACGDDGQTSSGETGSDSSASDTGMSESETETGTADTSDDTADTSDAPDTESDTGSITEGRVHVVLFTHIEDNTPGGTLGTPENEASYLNLRTKLIEFAELAQSYELQWVFQPDWKILLAAMQYEDAETMASTNDKNFLVYLRDDLGVVIDPHSHESFGYNYTDVAYLLELLEVGGSTVIGGHVWDPDLPEFQEWDRFRDPVAGLMYPEASWRGDILIGAGTPMHVNDPLLSGVWRPLDRDNYFTDDPAGNIVSIGAWHDDAAGVQELVDLYADGTIEPDQLLTASWNINPSAITAMNGLADIEASVLVPIASLRDQDLVVVTDFTTLVQTWTNDYAGEAFLYQP